MTKKHLLKSQSHRNKNLRTLYKASFDTAGKKKKRMLKRKEVFLNRFKNNFGSDKPLRPVVHCQTKLHNSKIKIGKGFSKEEIKHSNVKTHKIQSLGILIDKRRKRRTNLMKLNRQRAELFSTQYFMAKNNKIKILKFKDLMDLSKAIDEEVIENQEIHKQSNFLNSLKNENSLRSYVKMREMRKKNR